MSFLFRPLWVFVAVTIPQLVLLCLSAATFQVIESQLAAQNLRAWAVAGVVLALLTAGFTALAIVSGASRRPLPTRLGPALLLAYVPYLSSVAWKIRDLVPSGIPRWILSSGDQLVLVATLLMPALIYGLFLAVAWLTPEATARSAWKSFAFGVAIPFGWYLFVAGGAASWESGTLAALLPLLLILSAAAFLFFLVRTAYIVMTRRAGLLRTSRPLWLVLVGVVLPQLGLALHGGFLFGGSLPKGLFGDFSHPAFFLLAGANGLLLCLPSPRAAAARRALGCARALLLPFTVYFFLVFLPYFPLAVFGVFACGLGFLMLAPLLLLMAHAGTLREDYAAMRTDAGAARSAAALLAAALVLPALGAAACIHDRTVLHRALDQVYASDYAAPESPPVDGASLGRVLAHVRASKGGRGDGTLDARVPYLSPVYQRVVLGDLTLADATIRELELVFLGASALASPAPAPGRSNPAEVAVSWISAVSVPVDGGRAVKTLVELEIANLTDRTLEYSSSFALPEGAWIGGFHLQIGARREAGILAESRAAAWVYRRIVSTRRDPGILLRQEDGQYALRVFPLAARETRTCGFEILHREAFRLRIDGKEVALRGAGAAAATPAAVRVGGGEVHLVPPEAKRALPRVTRTPVLHFIVDCSVAAAHRREEFIRRIGRFLADERPGSLPARFTLADSRAVTFGRDDAWEQRVREHEPGGGFFLERSVKAVLRRHVEERGLTYPVLVVVTDALKCALVPGGLAAFSPAAPELDLLHHLGPSGTLAAYRFTDLGRPLTGAPDPWRAVPVLAYPGRERPLAYLPDDGRGSVVIAGTGLFEGEGQAAASPWEDALALEGQWRALQLDPAGRRRKELQIIRASFATGVLTPATAYIALEDEVQKQALRAKQRRTLAAHRALDVDEGSFERMSEPGWLPLLGVTLLVIGALSRSCSRRKPPQLRVARCAFRR